MKEPVRFDHISVVLHRPRFAENIGATARAAWNMGFSRILLVNPEDTDWERMTKLSTHVARGLLETMETHSDLAEALSPFQYVVGTTARLGGQRKEVIDPVRAAQKIASLGRKNRIALLFGPENRGLTNEELRFCQATVTIPTARPGSLNLAQAVLILCYEVLLAQQDPSLPIADFRFRNGKEPIPPTPETLDLSAIDSPIFPARNQKLEIRNSLASSFELEGMYGHLSEVLQLMDFLDKQNPDLWMMSLRRFFSRIGLYSNEVRLIRGICRQMKWFINRYRPRPDQRRTPDIER
ncbi:MAG: RNA methyltransferase [Thermodesulfobacteriota bacterium]